ncbi:MAG: response regulator transcription factor [Flavobacterium sp.]|nr:MAG: response regulator transcription factor [Flavobacterium sp.]
MLNILISDSKIIVREHIKTLLSGQLLLKVIATSSGGNGLTQALRSNINVELVIAGWYDGEESSLEWLRDVKRLRPKLPIIIVSNIFVQDFIREVFRIGVSGYLLTNVGREELLFSVAHIALGGEYISSSLAVKIIIEPSMSSEKKGMKNFESYSLDDLRLLQAIADGKSSSQMADMFFLSKRSIESRRAVLMKKTGTSNSAMLIKFAALNGLVH